MPETPRVRNLSCQVYKLVILNLQYSTVQYSSTYCQLADLKTAAILNLLYSTVQYSSTYCQLAGLKTGYSQPTVMYKIV